MFRIKRTKIKKDPVYIVGYWRSGTTFLQNLLTRDPQFGWFDPVRTVTFSNCIFMKGILAKAQKKLLQGARPMDNLEYTLDLPMEEVFAQATISTQAISHMLVFPDGGNGVKYHGGRVRPLGVLDQLHICPLGPHFQLLNGSGTEGVCRAQDHLTALIFQPQSQLADGSGLAYTVTPMTKSQRAWCAGTDSCRPTRYRTQCPSSSPAPGARW